MQENIAAGLIKCQEFCSLARTKQTQIAPNENTKQIIVISERNFSFAGVAIFSTLITFKEPVQQNVLKRYSSHILSSANSYQWNTD